MVGCVRVTENCQLDECKWVSSYRRCVFDAIPTPRLFQNIEMQFPIFHRDIALFFASWPGAIYGPCLIAYLSFHWRGRVPNSFGCSISHRAVISKPRWAVESLVCERLSLATVGGGYQRAPRVGEGSNGGWGNNEKQARKADAVFFSGVWQGFDRFRAKSGGVGNRVDRLGKRSGKVCNLVDWLENRSGGGGFPPLSSGSISTPGQ